MARMPLPDPGIHISQQQARRFMLAAHGLLPPREKEGKKGVLQVIRDLNTIQFDPIDIVGHNPDLVLQSRVKDYRSQMLDDLLYEERKLIDGWDKMSSVIPVEDWPYFSRHRAKMMEEHGKPDGKVMEIAPDVLGKIREDGPQSSLDFKGYEKADWFWGPTRTSRVALEALFAMGRLGIHHRENKRRYFDLIGNLLPEDLLDTPDPNPTREEYQSWHVWRRVGSLKFAHAHSGDHWGAILGVKSSERRDILGKLVEEGKVHALSVDGVPGRVFFIQDQDGSLLGEIQKDAEIPREASFIAPLDNLVWDRKLINWLFDFEYAWEVYKPKEKRKYGYYVLPVLLGDRFVARVEPVFEKEERCLTIQGWWWEEGMEEVGDMEPAIRRCLGDFRAYLGAETVRIDESVEDKRLKDWVERWG